MDDASFEKYRFLRLYAIDLDMARHTIKVLRRYKRPDVQYPLLRDIAVTYIRPFSGNKGVINSLHQLSIKKRIPQSFMELHKELHKLRMEQFAHTDLRHYQPKVSKFKNTESCCFPMSFKGFDYSSLMARIHEIEQLIIYVEQSIKIEIAEYEASL